jgi:hypothetical protein
MPATNPDQRASLGDADDAGAAVDLLFFALATDGSTNACNRNPRRRRRALRAHERRVQEAASGGKLTARRALGLLLAVLGLALVLVSALANTLDIGKGGFGWKQIVGVIVGVAVVVVGAALVLAGRRTSSAV